MPSIKVEIKNLADIKSAFARSPRVMTKNLQKAIEKSTLMVGRDSRRNTPVRTGRLRSSTYERLSTLKGEIGTNVYYGLFVHEGTRFMRARPYLKMAVDQNESAINKEFGIAVQDTLDELARGIG